MTDAPHAPEAEVVFGSVVFGECPCASCRVFRDTIHEAARRMAEEIDAKIMDSIAKPVEARVVKTERPRTTEHTLSESCPCELCQAWRGSLSFEVAFKDVPLVTGMGGSVRVVIPRGS